MIRLRSRLSAYGRDTRGAAAAEFALWATILIVPILSVIDAAFYVYQKMELELAGQAAAQAAWHLCDTTKLPAVTTCTNLVSTITTAAQSTSLGAGVTIPAGGVTEGYYCVTSSNTLQLVGAAGTVGTAPTTPSPNTCGTVIVGSTTAPGDYIQVQVSYTYVPVFNGVSLAALLTTPITKTTRMRLQ